jgi:hypothetical protein
MVASNDVSTPVDFEQFDKWLQERGDAKFTDLEVAGMVRLKLVAETFVRNYKGRFDFLIDLQLSLHERGFLSVPQQRGALNCYLADWKRRRKQKAEVTINLDEVNVAQVEKFLHDGIYTVIFNEDEDDYVTIKIGPSWMQDAPEGEQVAMYLTGPDNESDYQGFAFIRGKWFNMWKRFQMNERLQEALNILMNSDDPIQYGAAYALKSNRCWRCNHVLTVPASISRGLGPICAQAVGI